MRRNILRLVPVVLALFCSMAQAQQGKNTFVHAAKIGRELAGRATQCDFEFTLWNAPVDGKRIACRQLSLIGSEAQLPQLAPLLTDATLSDSARYALERIPGEAVNRALIRALSATSGTIRIGIINSLGVRGAPSARPELRALRNDRDPATAEAARAALRRRAPSPPG